MGTGSVYNVRDINSSFAEGSLDVMYTGGNRNGSHFEQEDVRRALPSLYNVPIVAHWMSEDDTIGGHDVEVVKDSSGVRLRALTEPCGVVPEHAKFYFKEKTDESGTSHTYLTIDGVLLWKRQDVFQHIENDLKGVVKHSMEINVNEGYEGEDGLYHITDFEFTALCLLEDCEPCFEGSKLTLFSVKNFKEKMNMMMRDLEATVFEINHTNDDTEKCSMNQPEGGEQLENKEIQALAEQYAIDITKLDFDINEFSLEELEEKFKAIHAEAEAEAFALESNLRAELVRAVYELEVIESDYGSYSRYWFEDYDKESEEVFVWDSNDMLLYGFKYILNGDAVSLDLESQKRKKFTIVDFEDGEGMPEGKVDNPVFQIKECLSKASELKTQLEESEAKFAEAENKLSEMNVELEALKEFKANSEKEIAKAERDAVLDEFSDLKEVEEFVALAGNCEEMAADELREKCYAIRGKQVVVAFSAQKTPATRVAVEPKDAVKHENNPYGDLFERFGVEKN